MHDRTFRRRPLFLPLAMILTAVTVVTLIALTSRVSLDGHAEPHPTVEAEQENPGEAELWEWMRLHDPATGRIPRGAHHAELAHARTLPARGPIDIGRSGRSLLAGLDWTLRGPANIGGRTRALALDVTDTNVLLAGGVTGGMWRSTDAGRSWVRTTLPSQQPSVTCIAQDTRPGRTGTWYHGTGEFRTNSTRFGNVALPGDGIFKSTDRGRSWTQLPSTVTATPQTLDQPFDFVNTIVADPSNQEQEEIYAATYGSIMRSTDGGTTWSATLGGLGNRTGYTTVAITAAGVLYAGLGTGGATHGVFRSTDGIAWTDITPATWGDSCKRMVIEIAPSNPNMVYILAETEERGTRVNGSYGYDEYYSIWRYTYRQGNGAGANGEWEDFSDNLPMLGGPQDYNGLSSYAMLLKVDPSRENTVWLGGSNLYRSTTGFSAGQSTWMGGYDENGNWGWPGSLHPDQHLVVTNPLNPRTVYIANDGGIWRTHSADQSQPAWEPLNNSYVTTQFYTVAIDHQSPGSETVMGGAQDNGTYVTTTSNPNEPWVWPFGGDGSFCAIANGGTHLYYSSQNGFIFRQDLADNTYTRIDPSGAAGYLFIAPFTLDPNNESIMYLAGGRTLWRNDDLSGIPSGETDPATDNWVRLTGTTATGAGQISAIGVSTAAPANRVYYGTADGKLYRIDDAQEGNPAPTQITGAGFPAKAYINCVAVDPLDGDRALAVFTNYNVQSLFHTTDAGATWTAVGGNLEQFPDGTGAGPSCRWGAITHFDGATRIFIATSVGLYSTSELRGDETVWEQEGASSIGNVRVDMIKCRESDGMVAVATWGHGIFTSTLPSSGVEESRSPVAGLSLEQPHPNPARDRATIRFTVPASAGDTRLALFDPLGREVVRLVDGRLEAGPHTATVDIGGALPAAMPNGVYFYRLDCGGRTMTRAMIVAR